MPMLVFSVYPGNKKSFILTVGLDEKTIRKYVRSQEEQEKKEESLQQKFLF